MSGPIGLLVTLWVLYMVCGTVTSFPSGNDVQIGSLIPTNSSHSYRDLAHFSTKRQESKVPLRILPIGASIVYGIGSSTGNGFRKPLRDALRYDGWDVDMVGSLHSGDMVDWNHEATPGYIITQVRTAFQHSAGFRPNLVVMNCGTNDALQSIDPAGAGERLRSLLNDMWAVPGMENTCIMLSTLIPTTNPTGAANRVTINEQYRSLAADLFNAGKCVYLADMDPVGTIGAGWISTVDDMISDGVHPNDSGHRKMASVLYAAINRAYNDGRIAAPSSSDPIANVGCDKTFGNGVYAGGLTQKGSGIGDGIYYHDSEGQGIIFTITSDWDRNQWFFARLYSRDFDDLVGWFNVSESVHNFGVWKNSADHSGKFTKIADLVPNIYCIPRGVHFIDMNADGLDDLVCIAPNGDAYLSVNQGDGTATNPPSFKYMGLIKSNEGWAQDRIRLGDIDGDGRGDYGAMDDSGNVWFWRNGWVDDTPAYWQPLGLRFTAKGMGDARGVRFEDVNGDGRDDWAWVNSTGQTYTWANARSCATGLLGDGLNVAWRQGFHVGASSGPTHAGMADFMTDTETYLRDRIHFARVYGNPQDFGLLGRQDYVFMQHTALSNGKHQFDVRAWKNIGSGGTKLQSDGNKYCNMMGHADGRMDYVWTLSKGQMTLYPNAGKTHITDPESFWDVSPGVIWTPPTDLNRRDLHLVDWDGDGDCDIVWVNPDANNQVSVWINNYPTTQNWASAWSYIGTPSQASGLQCSQKKGLGLYDLPVRFSDITGNGRGDYLCIEKDGRVSGFVQGDDGSWETISQIKFAEGKDRANIQWADVNGDGMSDMLWVDKFNGDGYVWYNRGRGDSSANGGSSFHWDKVVNPVYDGNHAGTCMFYPDLDGNGRADMHSLLGTWTNQAETWFNPSCGLEDREGDDAEGVTNPLLPVQPGSSAGGGGTGGGGSGGGTATTAAPPSGTVYISPDIYSGPDPVVACEPPCTLIFPPWILSTPTTISMPPATVTYEENWSTTTTINGAVITTSAASITSTVITVPPITTTEIDVWVVVWEDTDNDDNDIIWLTSSVNFPPVTLTKAPTTTTSTGTPIPIIWTYSPGPYPNPTAGGGPDDPPSPPPPGPPPGYPSSVQVVGGDPQPTCGPGQICGPPCLINCNPSTAGCIGICGCIGPFCDTGNCVGPGCSSNGGGGGGDPSDPDPTSCESRTTVSSCGVDCSVYEFPQTTSTICGDPDCSVTRTACDITGTTTTTTTTMSCPTLPAYITANLGDQVPILGGQGGGDVVDTGDFTSVPRTVTVTTIVTGPPTTSTTTTVVTATPSAHCIDVSLEYYSFGTSTPSNSGKFVYDGVTVCDDVVKTYDDCVTFLCNAGFSFSYCPAGDGRDDFVPFTVSTPNSGGEVTYNADTTDLDTECAVDLGAVQAPDEYSIRS
ncbi:killer toxin subunits alpha beta [Seiridium cupressi]